TRHGTAPRGRPAGPRLPVVPDGPAQVPRADHHGTARGRRRARRRSRRAGPRDRRRRRRRPPPRRPPIGGVVTITAARSPFRHEPGLDFAAPAEHARFEEALARVRSQLGRTYPLVIGGREVARGETFASLNPARPAEVIGHHAALLA